MPIASVIDLVSNCFLCSDFSFNIARRSRAVALVAVGFVLLVCQSALGQVLSEISSSAEIAPPPPPPLCVPDCRDGFLCYSGTCISACNPPCEPGFKCIANGKCAAQNAPVNDGPDTRIARKDAIRRERKELRSLYRRTPRITIGMAMMTSLIPIEDTSELVVGILPRIGFGMRIPITDALGVWAQGGPIFGVNMLSASGTKSQDGTYEVGSGFDGTLVSGGFAETGAYGGPFGPFAIGGVIGFMVMNQSDDTLKVESDGEPITFTAEQYFVGLYGLDISLLLGTRQIVHLFVRIMSGIPPMNMPLYAGAGISFDIPFTKPKQL